MDLGALMMEIIEILYFTCVINIIQVLHAKEKLWILRKFVSLGL